MRGHLVGATEGVRAAKQARIINDSLSTTVGEPEWTKSGLIDGPEGGPRQPPSRRALDPVAPPRDIHLTRGALSCARSGLGGTHSADSVHSPSNRYAGGVPIERPVW